MAFFTETQAAYAAGETVSLVRLAHFDFEEGAMRVWSGGIGKIVAGGQEWLGLGVLGSISDMHIGAGDAASITTFRLSGVDPDMIGKARESGSVRGRSAATYACFLSGPKRALDVPFFIEGGKLDVLSFSILGPRDRTITMTMESDFADRANAPLAMYSTRDQALLGFPDDRGLDYIPTMANAKTNWPFPNDG